ncbi:hypothetical protein VKT23_014283 [Stygiomarasmius scandens]|uniref:F-box domain-containing protein n=1 Tax=Marasmiellus scandens TaxID=2682957 RepID=A0ABR1J1H2_9AGAR
MDAPTPFSHLLNTNHSASDEEKSSIRALIAKPLERLASLNAEIDHLENLLSSLKEERRAVQSFVDAHCALISSFRRTPDEILSEIFSYCLPNDRTATRDVSEVPLVLGQICRRWKRVSLSTPLLWTSIHVVIPTKGDTDRICSLLESRRRGVEEWLARSGELPLVVSLYCNLFHEELDVWRNGDPPEQVTSMIGTIVRRFTRWKKVQFHVSAMAFNLIQTCMGTEWKSSDLRFLQAFEIYATECFYEKHTAFLSKILGAPCMSSVGFLNVKCLVEDLSFTNLSYLYFYGSQSWDNSEQTCLQILSQCPNLLSCALPSFRFSNSSSAALNPVFLPHLQKLSVRIDDAGYLHSMRDAHVIRGHPFFNFITAPSLQSLDVYFKFYARDGRMNDIPFFSLIQPGHHIQKLDLSMRLSPTCLWKCLSLCPDLTELNLVLNGGWEYQGVHDDTQSIISHLIAIPKQSPDGSLASPLCRSLRKLYIRIPEIDPTVRDESLMDLARSRRPGNENNVAGLEKLTISIHGRRKQVNGLGNFLNGLRSEGMDVAFSFEETEDDDPALGHPEKYWKDTPWF